MALGSLVLPVPHKQLNGLPYESFSVCNDELGCLTWYSHVISVFALTVMGTFEVLTAAHAPALSNGHLATSFSHEGTSLTRLPSRGGELTATSSAGLIEVSIRCRPESRPERNPRTPSSLLQLSVDYTGKKGRPTSDDKIPSVDGNGIPATPSPILDHTLIPNGAYRLTLRIEQSESDHS